jgi:hypothetical protein
MDSLGNHLSILGVKKQLHCKFLKSIGTIDLPDLKN